MKQTTLLIFITAVLTLMLISVGLSASGVLKSINSSNEIAFHQIEMFIWALVVHCWLVLMLMSIYVFQRCIRPLELLLRGVGGLKSKGIVYFPKFKSNEFHLIADYVTRSSIELYRLKKESDAFRLESSKDALTGLANRREMQFFLKEQFNYAQRYGHELHVIMTDIDHFKSLNDNYGHQVGDLCLQEISRLFEYNTRRTNELAARYGGEEFILLIAGMQTPDVIEWAERIRVQVENLKVFTKPDYSEYVSFTLSLGVSSLKANQVNTPDELIDLADQALYQAKTNGRNQVRLFNR